MDLHRDLPGCNRVLASKEFRLLRLKKQMALVRIACQPKDTIPAYPDCPDGTGSEVAGVDAVVQIPREHIWLPLEAIQVDVCRDPERFPLTSSTKTFTRLPIASRIVLLRVGGPACA